MKVRALLTILLLGFLVCLGLGFVAVYEGQQPRVLCEVAWEAPHNKSGLTASWFEHRPRQVISRALSSSGGALPDLSAELVHDPDGTEALKTIWKGSTALGDEIVFLHAQRLTPGVRYAFVGEIRRENTESDCRIGMNSLSFSGSTVNDEVREAHIADQTFFDVPQNSNWQPFALLVDESKLDFNYAAFAVTLSLGGPNAVYLRNLKFVQYSNGANPLNANPSLIRISQFDGWIGGGLALVLIGLGSVVFLVMHRRSRHERELRRIASLDS